MKIAKICEKICTVEKAVLTLYSQNSGICCGALNQRDGAVVQPVRILACHARGRGFESRPHRRGERRMSNC